MKRMSFREFVQTQPGEINPQAAQAVANPGQSQKAAQVAQRINTFKKKYPNLSTNDLAKAMKVMDDMSDNRPGQQTNISPNPIQ